MFKPLTSDEETAIGHAYVELLTRVKESFHPAVNIITECDAEVDLPDQVARIIGKAFIKYISEETQGQLDQVQMRQLPLMDTPPANPSRLEHATKWALDYFDVDDRAEGNVFLALAACANGGGAVGGDDLPCVIGLSHYSEGAVYAAIKGLEEIGLVKCVRRGGNYSMIVVNFEMTGWKE